MEARSMFKHSCKADQDWMPPGIYYIGDFFHHEEAAKSIDTIYGKQGSYTFEDGRKCAWFRLPGDGSYPVYEKRGSELEYIGQFAVESARVGCILLKDIQAKHLYPGMVYTFDEPFQVWLDDTDVHIGSLFIGDLPEKEEEE